MLGRSRVWLSQTSEHEAKIETHVKNDSKLVYLDSVTHESFCKLPPIAPPRTLKPPDPEPTSSIRFCGKSRYSEDFVNKEGYKVELVKGRDQSNRIHGSSIPNKVKEFLYTHDSGTLDIDAILKSKKNTVDSSRMYYDNPYLSDYLNT